MMDITTQWIKKNNLKMNLVNECFAKVKKDCFKYISTQETKTEKFKKKNKMLKSFLIPLCFWIANKVKNNKTITLGLSGGQGTGKTTISSIIKLILIKYFKLKVFKISIDDFYKTRKERITLSKKVHSLLLTRGVPGTHDIDLMLKFFNKIKLKKIKNYKLPKFNKAIDDRFKKDMWYNLKSKPDVIIFEGWCVGAKSQNLKKLKKPINQLEKKFDKKMKWRKHVNYQLNTKYKKLYDKLDFLLFLKASNFGLLRSWRTKQEKKLWLNSKNKKNSKVMNKDQIKNFMDTYQRITQQMIIDLPKFSSITMNLNSGHQIINAKYKHK